MFIRLGGLRAANTQTCLQFCSPNTITKSATDRSRVIAMEHTRARARLPEWEMHTNRPLLSCVRCAHNNYISSWWCTHRLSNICRPSTHSIQSGSVRLFRFFLAALQLHAFGIFVAAKLQMNWRRRSEYNIVYNLSLHSGHFIFHAAAQCNCIETGRSFYFYNFFGYYILHCRLVCATPKMPNCGRRCWRTL